jgi:carboxyl-terminal processing protease
MKRFVTTAVAVALLLSTTLLSASSAAVSSTVAPLDASEIAVSYQQLTQSYYEKINTQNVLNGARNQLLVTLRKAGVKSTKLPEMHAEPNGGINVGAVRREVESASKLAGAKISTHLLAYAAISGMLASVHDKYTVFLDPKEFAALNGDLNGADFGGTGIVIVQDDTTKAIDVSSVIPDGPADKAGIQQDDIIFAVNGTPVAGKTIQQASDLLRGKIGTTVAVTIVRDGKTLAPIALTRETIHQVSVFDRMLPGGIGYVALTVFGRDTGAELTTALSRLQKEGAKAIVMDLRGNGGGYLNAAIAVSSKFIPTGPIVSVEERASNITTYDADDTAISPLPLAVLVNGFTASASEITSGAIQDDGAGTIIGTKTFGKGVVQNVYPLPDGSAIKITIARYLTPHNRDINHLGIQPDIVVAENKSPRFGEPAKDAQLRRAIDYLNDRIAHLNT